MRTIGHCKEFKLYSRFDETPAAFHARVQQAMREDRDREVEKIRARFAKRQEALLEKIAKAEGKSRSRKESSSGQYLGYGAFSGHHCTGRTFRSSLRRGVMLRG